MSFISCLISVLTLLVVLSGCGREKSNSKAAISMQEAFVFQPMRAPNDQTLVELKKKYLNPESEFLLQGVLVPQARVAMGESLKSRVVYFEKHHNELFLKEAVSDHSIENDFRKEFILSAVRITKETDESVLFDFNELLSKLYLAPEWRAHDLMGEQYRPEFTSFNLRHPRLITVETQKDYLWIRQVGMVPINSRGADENIHVEIKYYLSSYTPSKTYQPVLSGRFRQYGFFEVAPRLDPKKESVVHASRFDPEKPIVFYYSANTPKDYQDAVKAGILYWNRAFQKEMVRAEMAPANITAPHPRYNIVQWVNDDNAGFAYADANVDPRTGETLHAQVYLTSTFAVSSRKQLAFLLKKNQERKLHPRVSLFSLAGVKEHEPHCEWTMDNHFLNGASTAAQVALSDDQILRVSQDYVSAVVAHEVGHTLGLRHNFAGSLDTRNYPLAEKHQIFNDYVQSGLQKEARITTSTVMDYLPLEEFSAVGSRIRQNFTALEYDKKAIQNLYFGKKFAKNDVPFFCTDSQVRAYGDCLPFDNGSSLIEFATYDAQYRISTLSDKIYQLYLSQLQDDVPFEALHPEEIGIEPKRVAETIFSSRNALFQGFSKQARLLPILRLFPFVVSTNEEEVAEEMNKYLLAEIGKFGGLANVLRSFDHELIQKDAVKMRGYIEQTRDFNASTKTTVKANVEAFYKRLPLEVANADLQLLRRIPEAWKVNGSVIGEDTLKLITGRVTQYVFSLTKEVLEVEMELPKTEKVEKDGKIEIKKTTVKVKAKLPLYTYPVELRVGAALMLKPGLQKESQGWGVRENTQAKKQLHQLAAKALGFKEDDSSFELDKLNEGEINFVFPEHTKREVSKSLERRALQWIIETKRVYQSF